MNIKSILFSALMIISASSLLAQQDNDRWTFTKKHQIGTQVFMVLTPILDPSPEFYQINYGHRLSPKDEISIEAITWTYHGPQGRPFGPDYESESSNYPGEIKSIGAGLAYKRMLWKGVYTQLHSTAFKQIYRDANKETIQNGFMLFNTIRIGKHFKLFKNRLFLAPSIGMTFWPVNTNVPEDFRVEDDKWNNFFLGEVGLHIGYCF